jgi:uncharacterized protein YuzE
MLRLNTTIDIGPFRFTRCSYDPESDVAYLSVGEPRVAITSESPEGHLLRLDPDTDELVGVTFLHVRQRLGAGPVTITFPEYVLPTSGAQPAQAREPMAVPQGVLSLCCL